MDYLEECSRQDDGRSHEEKLVTVAETKMIPKLRFPEFTDEWQVKKLGDVTKWASGGTPPKDNSDYWNGSIPWISAASMYGASFSTSQRTLTEDGVRKGSRIATKGSILLLVRGSMLFNTIPVGIAAKDVAFNQDVKAVTSDNLVIKYLFYFFKASEHKLLSKVVGTGIGAGKLDLGDLIRLKIMMPSKYEQEKIAGFLTVVDERVVLIEQQVELLKKYKKGIMQKIFTQKLRFRDKNGQNYPDWQTKKLGEIGKFYRGLSYDKQNVTDSGSLVLRSSNIHDNNLDYLNDLQFVNKNVQPEMILQKNDIAICMANGSRNLVGKSAVYDGNYDGIITVGAFCSVYRTRNRLGKFLFQTRNYRKYLDMLLAGTNINNLKNSDLAGLQFSIPSSEEEQQKIANFLSSIDDKIKSEEAKLESAKLFKKSLLQRMFA